MERPAAEEEPRFIKVLLVEDNPGDTRLIREYLREFPHNIFELNAVRDLSSAAEQIGRHQFDIVLLDLSLPNSHGMGTFRKMQEMTQARIPLILLTGNEDAQFSVDLMGSGAQDYLLKGKLEGELLGRSIMYAIERQRILLDLETRESQFIQLLENNPDPILLINDEGIVVYENRSAGEFFGSLEPMEGRQYPYDLPEEAEDDVEFPDLNEGQGKTGSVRCGKNLFKGEEVVVVNIRDITEKQRIAKELENARKLEGIGVLAGSVAHEFNNKLTGIMGNIAIAMMSAPPESGMMESLKKAEKSCQQAGAVVQKLLPFAQQGKLMKSLVPTKVFIKESVRLEDIPSSVAVEFSLQDDLWEIEVDVKQMKKVFTALVDNAVKACPQGGSIRIEAQNMTFQGAGQAGLPDGQYVKLTMEDSGEGMEKEVQNRIFEPFYTSRKDAEGLGLAISYAVIKKHKGAISVRSSPGEGSIFEIFLPARGEVSQPDKRVSGTESAITQRAGLSKGGSEGGRRSVLMMDDESDILEVGRNMMGFMGFEVGTVRTGTEAIEEYGRSLQDGCPYDAVILDLNIPGDLGGQKTLERLLALDPEVKAIVSSGYSNDPILSDYRRFGFKGAVAKPYSSMELRKVLSAVLDHEEK